MQACVRIHIDVEPITKIDCTNASQYTEQLLGLNALEAEYAMTGRNFPSRKNYTISIT